MAYGKLALSALTLMAIGCGHDIFVGGYDNAPGCLDSNGRCTRSQITLTEASRVAYAESTTTLTPRWTIPALDFVEETSAPNGGLWLFSSFRSDPFARRIDADAVTVRQVALPITPISSKQYEANTTFGASFRTPSAHPLGPTVAMTVGWGCPPEMPSCPLTNPDQDRLIVVVPEDANQAPFAMPCGERDWRCNWSLAASRSEDGQSLLLNNLDKVYAFTLDGQELWNTPMYDGFKAYQPFVALDAQSWLGYTYYEHISDYRAVVTLSQQHFDLRPLIDEGASTNSGRNAQILRNGTPGEYVLATERSTYYDELEGEGEYFDWQNQVIGDLSVLRLRADGSLLDQATIQRVDLPLKLEGAAIDSAGNVFLITTSSKRDPTSHALTVAPLLCRVAPQGAPSCFTLPQRATHLHAGAPNVVFVRMGTGADEVLARFDLPS